MLSCAEPCMSCQAPPGPESRCRLFGPCHLTHDSPRLQQARRFTTALSSRSRGYLPCLRRFHVAKASAA